MILYIHGFASCGAGNKVEALRRIFGDDGVISPDLPVEPDRALALLEDLLGRNTVRLLVGSSLGGFYADCLQSRHTIPTVMINPSTRPFETLKTRVGTHTNWCTGEPFEWKSVYLDQLRRMYRQKPGKDKRYLVLLQTADEVLDYRLAQSRYAAHDVVVEEGGNHRFENLADYAGTLQGFLRGR